MSIERTGIERAGLEVSNLARTGLDTRNVASEDSSLENTLITDAYYLSFIGKAGTATGSGCVVANKKCYIPFYSPGAAVYNRIGIEVTTAEASVGAWLSIHNDNNGVPGTVLLDAGEVSVASTGEIEATISQSIDGFVWLAVHFESGAAHVRELTVTDDSGLWFYGTDTAASTTDVTYLSESVAYGAAVTAGTVTRETAADIPNIYLRSV